MVASPAGGPRLGGISLVVPSEPCRAFHWHGAGTVDSPIERPETITHRVSHCHQGNDYYGHPHLG